MASRQDVLDWEGSRSEEKWYFGACRFRSLTPPGFESFDQITLAPISPSARTLVKVLHWRLQGLKVIHLTLRWRWDISYIPPSIRRGTVTSANGGVEWRRQTFPTWMHPFRDVLPEFSALISQIPNKLNGPKDCRGRWLEKWTGVNGGHWTSSLLSWRRRRIKEAACTALGLSSASFRPPSRRRSGSDGAVVSLFAGSWSCWRRGLKNRGSGQLCRLRNREKERTGRERERRKSGERVMESERGIDLGTGSRNEADERRGCSVAGSPSFITNSFRFEAQKHIAHKSRKMKQRICPANLEPLGGGKRRAKNS